MTIYWKCDLRYVARKIWQKHWKLDIAVFCNYDCHVSVDLHWQHERVCNSSNSCIIFKKSINDILVDKINGCVGRSRNKVLGFAWMLIRVFSADISSVARDTKEFLLSVSICAFVGIPCRKGA